VSLRHFLCLLGLLAAGFPAPIAVAQEGQTVRPEIGKHLQAAVELLKGKKGKEALAKAREAQAVPDKTPYESYLATRVYAQAAAAAGEAAGAAQAFEIAAASPSAPDAERRQFLGAAAGQYYVAKDYAKAAELAARYLKQGGTDASVRTIHVQALYLGGQYAAAANAIQADVEALERSGKAPPEDQLQLLANAYLHKHDTAGYAKTMEKLLAYYPKRDYWINVLHGIASRPGFSERLALDVARLKMETGTLRTADEYLDAAQLSLLDGFPVEAAKIIDQGYAAGLLGAGQQAGRHRRLKELAAKNLAADRKDLARDEAAGTAGKDGKTLFNDGFNYVLHGKSAKGLEMMQQGMRLGVGAKRPDHAKLQLAYAYHLAGQNQKAVEIFSTVQGTDGAATLARLWITRLSRKS
jgi:hypothetical protein